MCWAYESFGYNSNRRLTPISPFKVLRTDGGPPYLRPSARGPHAWLNFGMTKYTITGEIVFRRVLFNSLYYQNMTTGFVIVLQEGSIWVHWRWKAGPITIFRRVGYQLGREIVRLQKNEYPIVSDREKGLMRMLILRFWRVVRVETKKDSARSLISKFWNRREWYIINLIWDIGKPRGVLDHNVQWRFAVHRRLHSTEIAFHGDLHIQACLGMQP